MKKWMLGVLIGLGAAAIGVGGAFACNTAFPVDRTAANAVFGQNRSQRRGSGQFGGGMFQRFGQYAGQQQSQDQNPYGPYGQNGMRRGMWNNNPNAQSYDGAANTGERITLDDAYSQAQEYVTSLGSNLKIAEVMEFQNHFYVAVIESDSGRGAVELLVDAYTGNVSREMGAGHMWNLKYGRMGMMSNNQTATDSTLTLEEARAKAQQSLDSEGLNAVLNDGGYSFYGYYTFDYSIDGQITGMLSVNGLTGDVLYHHWHGTFISEKEY